MEEFNTLLEFLVLIALSYIVVKELFDIDDEMEEDDTNDQLH